MFKLLTLLLATLCWPLHAGATSAGPAAAPPWAVAFYYGDALPVDELQAFDLAVIDPDQLPQQTAPAWPHTRVAAYLSVGEVHPGRAYASRIPPAWLRGQNSAWGSLLVDQTQAGWSDFFIDQVFEPLWARGYRTFFLDTLDSYQLFSRTDAERAAQEAAMAATLQAIVRRHPEVAFVFNRGFEILERTRSHVIAVAAESLYQRYDAGTGRYGPVPAADRDWLLQRLQAVRRDHGLPVIAIDYVPPGHRDLARETARQISALGFTPWVATPDLASLGVGAVEVQPRRVLVVHSPLADDYALRTAEPVLRLSMPLNHLGYVPEFVSLDQLPQHTLSGRYAGAVLWPGQAPTAAQRLQLLPWLERQVRDGLPLAFVNQVEFLLDTPLAGVLGLQSGTGPRTTEPIRISAQSALLGFETPPRPAIDAYFPLTLANGQPLLTLQRGQTQQAAAALTPWGGYVLAPYAVVTLPGDQGDRWVIDPFAFLQQALRLPVMPVPDTTTESGRRMLMVHMDGDGFVSRSELPRNPLAGEVVRDRVVRRYRLPMTLSVIEAEIAPQGLYPALSPLAEQVARDIFREPHVAIASHSYSHPFSWARASASAQASTGADNYNLRLPGYQFSLQREIEGSVQYIERQLAPPGKRVEMFLWTGDCVPGSDALGWTTRMNLLNMNGGDTVATRARPSLTQVEGLGLQRRAGFQVFAPNQNENVYTNNWQGPFYGFERVIETFELTETPRRLKPVNIYFHTYITTRRAGLQSLDKVFAWALAQETTPVHAADYARKVLDFQHLVVARTPDGWRIRGQGELRTLRLPGELGSPDLQRSRAVAGYRPGDSGTYVHLAAGQAELVLGGPAASAPRLHSANARIEDYRREGHHHRWTLQGQVPLAFTLDQADHCQVRAGGQALRPSRRQGSLVHYTLTSHAARPLEAICQP